MFEASARLKVRAGKLEGFKQQADVLVHQLRRTDDPPLRCDWFLSDNGTECEVREAYVDAIENVLTRQVTTTEFGWTIEPPSTIARRQLMMSATDEVTSGKVSPGTAPAGCGLLNPVTSVSDEAHPFKTKVSSANRRAPVARVFIATS